MHPHDRLFRHIFSDPENAAGELRSVFSWQLSAAIDWSTLKLEPGTYVDKRLDELRSDLLFSARCAGRPVLIYFLMEHQSSDDRFMALRLLGYMVKIWDDYRRAHQGATHLPAILPLVVCHDDAGWHAPRAFGELLDIPPGMADVLAPQMVSFEMLLDDLTSAKSEELWDRAMSELGRATLFVLKRARQSPDMTAELMPYAGLLRDLGQSAHGLAALGAILRYILAVNEASPERVLEFARALGPRVEENIMTGEQVLLQRGEAKGKAEGKAEGVLRVLAARGLTTSGEQRSRILACTDLKQLDDWLDRAGLVGTTDEIFSD